MLKDWIRSLHRPCLGTFTVNGVGNALPSLEKTTMVMVRAEADCRGKERYMNGSKVTETFPHTGQTRVDLYWPCQIFITETYKLMVDSRAMNSSSKILNTLAGDRINRNMTENLSPYSKFPHI